MKRGKVDIIKEKNNRLYARVAEEELRYSLEDDLVFVPAIFPKEGLLCAFGSSGAFFEK